MNGTDNAEVTTEGRKEEQTGQLRSHSNSGGRVAGHGQEDEDQCQRTDRAHRSRGGSGSTVTGGILDQLIAMQENRLSEVEDCIDWYEREKRETRGQLENLRKLKALHESQDTEE